jgi:general secretion pathway protein I
MIPRRSNSALGFTLLEVLLATMIIGSVFVAVVGLLSQSLRNIERMNPQDAAIAHAREKMNAILVSETLEPQTSSGRWDDGYRWEAQISFLQPSSSIRAGSSTLFRIHLQVRWGEEAVPKTYVVETVQWAQLVNHEAR